MPSDAKIEVLAAMRDAWRAKPLLPIADWARENVVLPKSDNARHGGAPYDSALVPHVEVLFDFLQDADPSGRTGGPVGEWRELVIAKPSQFAISTAAFVAMAWKISHDACPHLYITDTRENMKEMVKQRVAPILESVGERIAEELDDRNQTTLTKRVNGSLLRFGGAQSSAGLISFPASWVFIDEAEVHDVLPEGSTIELGVARAKADDEHKIVIFSKPQDEPRYTRDESTGVRRYVPAKGTIFWDRYLSGTQERMEVPCPECGKWQPLDWAQVKYEHCRVSKQGEPPQYDMNRVIRESYIECVHCHHGITEAEKRKIVGGFRLRPSAVRAPAEIYPEAFPGRRSVQGSDLYNISSDAASIGMLAAKWIEAQGDDEKLNAFYNDHLGRPRPRVRASAIEIDSAKKLMSPYRRMGVGLSKELRCPIEPYFIGMAVDCQQSLFKWMIAAFASTPPDYADNGEIYVLDWGAAGDYQTLEQISEMEIIEPSGEKNTVWKGLIDARFRPHDQYEFCWDHPSRKFIPAMGEEAEVASRALVRARAVRWKPDREIEVAHFASQSFETELYDRRISRFNRQRYDAERTHRHPRIHLPEDADDAMLREVTNMHLVQVERRKGFHAEMWKKKFAHMPNDFGDTLKMLMVLWVLEGREVVRSEDD